MGENAKACACSPGSKRGTLRRRAPPSRMAGGGSDGVGDDDADEAETPSAAAMVLCPWCGEKRWGSSSAMRDFRPRTAPRPSTLPVCADARRGVSVTLEPCGHPRRQSQSLRIRVSMRGRRTRRRCPRGVRVAVGEGRQLCDGDDAVILGPAETRRAPSGGARSRGSGRRRRRRRRKPPRRSSWLRAPPSRRGARGVLAVIGPSWEVEGRPVRARAEKRAPTAAAASIIPIVAVGRGRRDGGVHDHDGRDEGGTEGDARQVGTDPPRDLNRGFGRF